MRSPQDLRQNLAHAIICVRSGRAASRRSLADVMRLSPTTAGMYADQLIAAGYLQETGLDQGAMGRPKRALRAVPSAGWFAGVEFNAERIRVVSVDFAGQYVSGAWHTLSSGAGTDEVIVEVVQIIRRFKRSCKGPLLAIGFGAPGIVHPSTGVAVDYAFMDSWRNVPVVERLKKQFKVPVTLENNVRAIAVAERWFGGARELSDFVVLGPRSGFGIAIVQNGELLRGANHAAGEIGYWPSPTAGANTKVHDHLSSPAVWRRLIGKGPHEPVPNDLRVALIELAFTEGEAWRGVIQDYAQLLSTLQLVLDTSMFFLHGPLTALEPRFCDDIGRVAKSLAPSQSSTLVRVVASQLNDDAGALGAATLAMEGWIPPSL